MELDVERGEGGGGRRRRWPACWRSQRSVAEEGGDVGNGEAKEEEIEFPKRKPNLYSIYEGGQYNEHRVMLEDLIRQQEASERKLARKQGSLSSARADLYQILGLFFVFQGVVLTAVSQTNQLDCSNSYLPLSLALLVSIFAFAAAVQKLREAIEFSEQCLLEKALYNALSKSIDLMREEGKNWPVERFIPDLPAGYTRPELHGHRQLLLYVSRIFYVWVRSYAGAVLLLILAFSALTLISVDRVLCHSGYAESSTQPPYSCPPPA